MNLFQLFFNIVTSQIYTLSPAVVQHSYPIFVKVGILGVQKVVYGLNDIIISAEMATTELLLHLGKKIVV